MKALKIMKQFWPYAAVLSAFLALLGARNETISHLAPPVEPIPLSFFGMHIHNIASSTPWPAVSVPAWRLWDARVQWPQLEPNPGQWTFGKLDAYVSLAEQHNTEILLPLGLSPEWASARPQERSVYQAGFAAEPQNINNWRDYVTTVAKRYKGRIRAYEIWNEPNNKGFWTGDMQQIVTLTREASQIIHQIDPQAYVVSPSATTASGIPWLASFLKAGGGQYVDVIGFHFYVAPLAPEAMVPLSQKVRQVMMDTGAGDKPLWNTESGWQLPKPFPVGELGAAYLARAYILSWATGVRRFYWYAWDNHTWASLETTDADNQTPTHAGRGYEMIQKWLVGAQMNGCDEDSDHTWICQITREGTPSWIVWNPAGPRTFSVPLDWRVKSVTPLLGEARPLDSASLEIGSVPELVTSVLP